MTSFVDQDHNRLFGADALPGIVAIERSGDRNVRIFRRVNSGIEQSQAAFSPWLVTTPDFADSLRDGVEDIERLNGNAALSVRVRFSGWSSWFTAHRALRDANAPLVAFGSPVEQYLIDSGQGCFRNMLFDELQRAQIDIETLGLDPTVAEARIIIVTASINGRDPLVLRGDQLSEREMIDALSAWIHAQNPDIIEGHNLFNFDLPFLVERARRSNALLLWGRDGSAVRVANEQRFKAGPRTIPFRAAYVYGRHFIDTYQQIQRYDTAGLLDSYGLKPAIAALGLGRSERIFVEGARISETWRDNRDELIRYAVDDVLDVNALSELTLPTELYQTRILPRGLQSSATGGPGEKINDLFVRAYLAASHSIPMPSPPQEYPGGYSEIRAVGRFAPVVKCDVESLYPSIMLAEQIAPASDTLQTFLPMLRTLTDQRLHAKRSEQRSTGIERARWNGIQASFKVLINSFYGYLGYGRAYFNDYDAARRVTLRGQDIVLRIVDELEKRGAQPIEIDTDGVFFQPPDHLANVDDEQALIETVTESLGAGIRLAHDGRYKGMLSLKLKNYALLEYDGRVILKGSSLRSRREELFLRRFVRDAVARLLQPEQFGSVRDYYLDLAEQISTGQLQPEELSRWETVTEQTHKSESNRRLSHAIGNERVGERIQVYQRSDGLIARLSDYDQNEDKAYLLKRLRDMAERFRPLYPDGFDFDHTFPIVSPRTDLAALRDALQATQLNLFPDVRK
ncbi:MAG: DNA polymerase domain-containing protein [Thermomicrobiales bacterium]